MNLVRITGWRTGLNAIALVRIIRSFTGWGLAQTKESVDRMIEGTPIEIEFEDANDACRFETEVISVGCLCDLPVD